MSNQPVAPAEAWDLLQEELDEDCRRQLAVELGLEPRDHYAWSAHQKAALRKMVREAPAEHFGEFKPRVIGPLL